MAEVNKDIKCDICPIKARYDNNPKSFLGRLWRWHMNQLSAEERQAIATRYNQKKYLQ